MSSRTHPRSTRSEPQSIGANRSSHHEPEAVPAYAPLCSSGQQLLYTPAEAAEILAVKESWLRRQAGLRRVPSTRLGKHLRFSHANLEAIVESAQRTTCTRTAPPGRRR
ncbi:helix-turn-helix domain-containing protein [Lentzea pudingi]|uniref:helix-turn-helix domain-containing protein n=1 Tax=Lentzea pudingi TaxID=1789439 RepID=UPI001664FC06|nr:helix-turn-helix domain-containing protein [Lentzea pudingi]